MGLISFCRAGILKGGIIVSIEKLEELDEDITDFIELLADKPNELEDLNPLFAHINIVKILYQLIPILKHQSDQIADLRQELAKKEDAIDIGDVIKEARLRNG